MKVETLKFLRTVIAMREMRTGYMKKLIPVADKVIPVISTYSEVTGERRSIIIQENELRLHFQDIAFRTFLSTFPRDIVQIKEVIQGGDYLIMDWEDLELDLTDGDQYDVVEELKNLNCQIIIHRNPFPKEITNSGLEHCNVINSIDNSHIENFSTFGGSCFSDYAGIKKDSIGEGGVISPGFIFYDATENRFYGYKYKYGSHKKGEKPPDLEEFETTIVPAIINSSATKRMLTNSMDYLGRENMGWRILKNIELGGPLGESGKSPAKFKRIGMEHYLHCMKIKISNGDFD